MKITDVINPLTGQKVDVQKQGVPLLLGVVVLLFIWQGGNALAAWVRALVTRTVAGNTQAGDGWTQQ